VKDDAVFLTVGEVLGLHSDQIREFGGAEGIRDQGALESGDPVVVFPCSA
jgi:hypothetical protein